jgi:hypothetical protein
MGTVKKGARAGRALDESGVEFFAVLLGAPSPKDFAATLAAAGWTTGESAYTPGSYEAEHTWAALDVGLSEDDELTISGTVLPRRVADLRKLLEAHSRKFTCDVQDANGRLAETLGVEPPELYPDGEDDEDG